MSDRICVAILMGGDSTERDVSLVSGRAVMEAIDTDRFDAYTVDLRDIRRMAQLSRTAGSVSTQCPVPAPESFWSTLAPKGAEPDIAFIALHGKHGEDGAVQGMLELIGIPYTGSGILSSALCMDKNASKKLLKSCSIPTPAFSSVTADSGCDAALEIASTLELPVIVKPNNGGSTIGVTIAHSASELAAAIAEALRYDSIALVEQFVTGTEITVGILGNSVIEALPIVEIHPKTGFYDYEAKYTAGLTEKICPANLDDTTTAISQAMAADAHRALGCSGMSRVDLIVTPDGPTVLEINTIPGMTPTSLLPRAAQVAGYSFTDLISRIIDLGIEMGLR